MNLELINWTWVTVIGVALLAIVLLWAMLRNKSSRDEGEQHTEEATRELYRQEDAARDPMDDGTV